MEVELLKYFNCAIQGKLIDFEIRKIVFIIKGVISLIRFPNSKYPPEAKKCLMCLRKFIIWGVELILGGRDYLVSESHCEV